jgi:hypothetical protein
LLIEKPRAGLFVLRVVYGANEVEERGLSSGKLGINGNVEYAVT